MNRTHNNANLMQIAVIGIDGSGKSTVTDIIREWYSSQMKKVLVQNIKGTNTILINNFVDEMNKAQQYKMKCFACFFDILAKIWETEENKKSYDVVVWDRHIPCLNAYYEVLGIDTSQFQFFFQSFCTPLYIYLDVDPAVAVERIYKRGNIKSLENVDYLSKVKKQYDKLSSNMMIKRIDANKGLGEVKQEILDFLGMLGC